MIDPPPMSRRQQNIRLLSREHAQSTSEVADQLDDWADGVDYIRCGLGDVNDLNMLCIEARCLLSAFAGGSVTWPQVLGTLFELNSLVYGDFDGYGIKFSGYERQMFCDIMDDALSLEP